LFYICLFVCASVDSSVTKLVNMIFWKQINRFWRHKWSMG